jgi:septal ring factor EnvC (AmiA/AmiB activator)
MSINPGSITPRQALQATSENTTEPEAHMAAQALASAYAWCAAAIKQSRLSRTEALVLLAKYVKPLTESETFFKEIAGLLEVANASPKPRELVSVNETKINNLSQCLSTITQEVKDLEHQNRQIQVLQDEIQQITQRKAELEHVVRLWENNGLDELRAQVKSLEDHTRLVSGPVSDLEKAIGSNLQKLVQLSEARFQNLQADLKSQLEKVNLVEHQMVEINRMLYELDSQILEAEERHKVAEDEFRRRSDVLRLYEAADRAVAEAVPGGRSAADMLNQVEVMLRQADETLIKAIEANKAAQEMPRLFFTRS